MAVCVRQQHLAPDPRDVKWRMHLVYTDIIGVCTGAEFYQGIDKNVLIFRYASYSSIRMARLGVYDRQWTVLTLMPRRAIYAHVEAQSRRRPTAHLKGWCPASVMGSVKHRKTANRIRSIVDVNGKMAVGQRPEVLSPLI